MEVFFGKNWADPEDDSNQDMSKVVLLRFDLESYLTG